jgi:hypothetical protein
MKWSTRNAHASRTGVRVVIWLAAAWLLAACAAQPMSDPAAVMVDRQQPPARRMAAARQMRDADPAAEQLQRASATVLWSHGYTQAEREAALLYLLETQPQATRDRLAAEPQFLPSVDILRTVYRIAAERGWREFTSTAVRMYAEPLRGIPDTARPERALLTSLNDGGTPEQILTDVFANRQGNFSYSDQVAAWLTMCRLLPRDELVRTLHETPPERSALIVDLQHGWDQLGVLPATREQVLWLLELRADRGTWQRCVAFRRTIDDHGPAALLLRHYAASLNMAHALPILRDGGMAAVDRVLEESLARAEVYRRNPGYPTSDMDPPQTYAEVRDSLSSGDRLVLLQVIKALNEPRVVAALFAQADVDRADTTTEHAGVLYQGTDGAFIARAVPPLIARHDTKHYASPDLVFAAYRGLAHYHFHAQKHDNREHAGPGRGDMVFAENMGFNCLLLTFVTRDKLNVDFYADGRLIVDLGVIDRPATLK